MIYVLIGYMWLFVHRPFEVWPVLGNFRIERVYMLFAIAAWLCSGKIRWIPNLLHLAFAAFALAVLFCWQASPWSGLIGPQTLVENYFKILVFYVMLVSSIREEEELKLICLGFLGVMGLYMAHSFREFLCGRHAFRMGISRMIGVDSTLEDPNSFAASIVYALPLVVPGWLALEGRNPRWKRLLIGYVALSGLCVILTGSRSGFVGLLVASLVMILRSRSRRRLLVYAAVLLPLLWFLIPPDLQNRFYTLIDPSVGPANAQVSAESRSDGFWIGLQLWQKYPLTGCGPGAWIPSTGMEIESHNLFGQVPGEMGTLGVLTFGWILLLLWNNARAIKSTYRRFGWEKDFLYFMADAIGVGLILLLLQGWGGHNLFRYNWLWFGAFLVVARHLVDQKQGGRLGTS